LSFEQAARELGISEEELEKLVAQGKIAAIKDGDALLFKKSAVDHYKSRSREEDHILLSDEEIDLLGDDAEIDFGIEAGTSDTETTPTAASAPGGKKAPAAGGAKAGGPKGRTELSLDEDLPEIDLRRSGSDELALEDVSVGSAAGGDETVLSLDDVLESDVLGEGDSEATTPVPSAGESASVGDDTLLDTDILDIGEEDRDAFELDTTEDTLIDPTEEGTLLRGGGARVMQMKRRKSHAAWTAVLAVAALVMLVPCAVLLSTVYIDDLRVSEVQADEGRAQLKWIKDYGEPFKGAVGSFADLFNKRSSKKAPSRSTETSGE
jgi:excisionase family DNA binding protein